MNRPPTILVFLCALTLCLVLSGPATAASAALEPAAATQVQPDDALPPGCLAVLQLADIPEVIARVGALSQALSGADGPAQMRAALADLLDCPDLAGLDFAAPVTLYYMDPKTFLRPWTVTCRVADAAAFRKALAPVVAQGLTLMLDGPSAVYGPPAAVKAISEWLARHPKGPAFARAAQIRLRLDAQRALTIFAPELDAQVKLMKERMADALEKAPDPAAAEQEARQDQAQLDALLALLRLVKEIEMTSSFEPERLVVDLDVRPLPDSLLQKLVAENAAGAVACLNRCPPRASFVLAGDLFIKAGLRDALLRRFSGGWSALLQGAPARGDSFLALIQPESLAQPGAPADLLLFSTAAPQMLETWQRLTQPPQPGATIRLEPLPPDAAAPDIRRARVVVQETAFGSQGTGLLQFILGEEPAAALLPMDGGVAAASGPHAGDIVRETAAMLADQSLMNTPAYRGATAGIALNPKILAYISPVGLLRWLRLGGIKTDGIAPDTTGMLASVALGTDGAVRLAVRVPTGALTRALAAPPQN